MDNTFMLQSEENSNDTGSQKTTVAESDTGIVADMGTLSHMDTNGFEESAEHQKLEEAMTMERPYKLRPLKDKDLFQMLKILRKIGVGEFKSVFSHFIEDRENNEKNKKEIGMAAVVEAVEILISNIPNAEAEIYNLLSDLSEIKVDELKEMEFGTLPMMLMDTFMNVRGTSFFKGLSKFF